jgi:hypothetical protein
MLTERQVERIARLVRLAPHMTGEQQEALAKLISDLKTFEGSAAFPQSAIEDAVKAVPNAQEIVKDLRSGVGVPGWMPPPKKSLEGVMKPEEAKDTRPDYLKPETARGWRSPLPMESPPGLKYIDQMVDAQDRLDRLELERRLRGDG